MVRHIAIFCLITVLLTAGIASAAAQGDPDSVTHTVQQGETLTAIAEQYGITLQKLLAANNVNNPALVTVGQVLVIPIEAAPIPANTGPEPGANQIVAVLGPDDLAAMGYEVGRTDFGPAAWGPTDRAMTPERRELLRLREAIINADPAEAAWVYNMGIVSLGDPARLREIYAAGRTLGNNPRAFSKIGDCNSEPPYYLARFDGSADQYDLGPYTFLDPLLDYFAGSFERDSMVAYTGNHAWAVFDATWANPYYCDSGETPIACEFRINRPSFVLVRLGTNEANYPVEFENSLRQIVEYAIENGVIPILGTKADQREGSDYNNQVIRRIASEFGVPLWDFSRLAATLPERGLMPDGIHMTIGAPYFGDPAAMSTGHTTQNLTALVMLQAVTQAVIAPE